MAGSKTWGVRRGDCEDRPGARTDRDSTSEVRVGGYETARRCTERRTTSRLKLVSCVAFGEKSAFSTSVYKHGFLHVKNG